MRVHMGRDSLQVAAESIFLPSTKRYAGSTEKGLVFSEMVGNDNFSGGPFLSANMGQTCI